ncbi:MAG TPA: hypothetical protein ENI45_02515, partial [Thermoplasmatales archaeon]|nr:hypothetical protein [Thermoplasmatales archaeon]
MEKEFISVFVTLLIITAAASAAIIDRDTDETHEKTFLVCPADFEMLIYCGGFDTWNPIYMLYANATGDTFYYILKPEDRVNGNFTLVSRFNFTDDEIGQIWDEIVANDFFNLNDHYARESVVDGTFANITVTGNGVTHTAQTENIDVDRFDSIVKTVNSLTPGDNDLYYNALVNHAPVKPGKPVGPVNGTVRKECSYTSV